MVSIADRDATVLVTRSEPGASELAEALRAAGYVVQCCPVLEIRPLEASWDDETNLDGFDIAICVSGHAARLVLERFDPQPKRRPDLTWIAVGAATARVLAERGVEAQQPANESSEGILALASLQRVVGKRVLICAGRGGRSLLVEELMKRGARVRSLALYERVPVPAERVATLLDSTSIGVVIVSSADGARAFAPAWRTAGGDPRVAVVVPSARVAEALADLGFQCVTVAGGAGANATVAALRKIGEGSK